MPEVYDEWKKEIEKKLKELPELEKIPAMLKRCPKCNSLTLEFDPKTGRIYCTKCGFEERIPVLG